MLASILIMTHTYPRNLTHSNTTYVLMTHCVKIDFEIYIRKGLSLVYASLQSEIIFKTSSDDWNVSTLRCVKMVWENSSTLATVLTDVEPIHALSASISNPVYFPVLKEIKHGSVTRSTASSSQTRLGDVHSFCTKEIQTNSTILRERTCK